MSNQSTDRSQNKSTDQPHDMSSESTLKDQRPHDYVTHNYEAMNRAIDTEVDQRVEISELYRYEGSSRRTLMIMHLATSLSVVAVAVAVIFWMYYQPNLSIDEGTQVSTSSPALDRSTSDALALISAQESPALKDKPFIDTSFTVFHRTLISTGEYVVTGKTYAPDNLSYPEEQYCYLEKIQSNAVLSGEPLAAFEDHQFMLETEDLELIDFARKHCQFSQ